jgi:RNA polymerase primary sigma factor
MQHLRDLRQYVTDLASIPRLSQEETCQLTSRLVAARQGALSPEQTTHAKQRLIVGHLWLAVALVKRSGARLCTLSPLDLVQEGNLGLLHACDRFDFASGGNFTAYASTTIYYAILDALPIENTIQLSQDLTWRNRTDERVEALRALQPLSLDAMHGEEDCAVVDRLSAPPFVLPDPAAEAEQWHQAKSAQVETLLSRLTPREQQVLRLRYGLDEADGHCHAPTAIARQLGLDCSTVHNLERGALQKLRALSDPEEEQAHHDPRRRRPLPPRSPQEQAERRQKQVQRLKVACAELVARSREHVGSKAAAAFLKHYHPVVRPKPSLASKAKPASPAKASPQERLQAAYTRLVAQGEQVTRVRLRQVTGSARTLPAPSCGRNVQVTHTQIYRRSSSEHRQA